MFKPDTKGQDSGCRFLSQILPSKLQMEGSDNSDLGFDQKSVEATPYYTPHHKPSLPESGIEPVNIDFSSPGSVVDGFGACKKEELGSSSTISSDSESESLSPSETDRRSTPVNTDLKDKTDSILLARQKDKYKLLLKKYNNSEGENRVRSVRFLLSEQKNQRLMDQLEKSKGELDSVRKELKLKVNDLECAKGQVLELQKQKAKLETHVPDCCNKIADLMKQLEETKEQLKTSNDELVRVREELGSRVSDTNELQAQLEMAKENMATLECQLDSGRKQILELQERISCYKANETKHARVVKRLKDDMLNSEQLVNWEREQMQSNIHNLSEIQKKMGSAINEWKARGVYLQNQLVEFEAEKLRVQEQHDTEQRALMGEISCLKEELDQRRHDIEAVNIDFDKHKLKYDMLATERDEANAKIDKLTAEISFRDNRIKEMEKELSLLRAQNTELISISEARNNLVNELKMNKEELEKEVTRQKVVISERAEEKREAIKQLCISLEHYRSGYKELLQVFTMHRRHLAAIAS
ncbi:hypothetical protein PIB30_054506 [Stylosanthes scabra]|uniref:Uncharacterized protein n=1 Tax=Stylosanthes scabra TaxID=79078 RepID=A0ABU6TKY2_9FABA|nr:hypothetical protein [Stylosanthes scabra]